MKKPVENPEEQYRQRVEQIGLKTIRSLNALKTFLNDGGSGRGLFSMDSDTLDLAAYIRSLGGYLIPRTQERKSQVGNWKDNPRYRTTLYINQIITIVEKGLLMPDEIEKEIVNYLRAEKIQPGEIIENAEIIRILDNHLGEMCDTGFELGIDLDHDPIAQRLIKSREQQECEAKFKFRQVRMNMLERLMEIGIVTIDRVF